MNLENDSFNSFDEEDSLSPTKDHNPLLITPYSQNKSTNLKCHVLVLSNNKKEVLIEGFLRAPC